MKTNQIQIMNKNNNEKKPLAACQLANSSQTPPACAENLIDPADKFRPGHVEGLMRQAGFKCKCAPELLLLATLLPETSGDEALEKARDFFASKACMVPSGLETLPGCWLSTLPEILWSLRKPHWQYVPFFICEVAMEGGVLLLRFAQELPETRGQITGWDWTRIHINAALYPSRWRPLKREDMLKISALLGAAVSGSSRKAALGGFGPMVKSENTGDHHGKKLGFLSAA
jgi:hypothetical protein